MKIRTQAALLLALLVALLSAQTVPARAGKSRSERAAGEDVIWTSWDAVHYALVDDGDHLWIATGSGLVQYDKSSGAHLRISTADGLPHRHVYCGAVDGGGSRWFGGDAGLSRLDAAGEWLHYNSANSGLASDWITAIAATAAGDVWLSYRDRATISRLRPDGSWQNYPNRETAVSLAFDNIKETLNQNDLWTAAAAEVWIGYNVFDGVQWRDRTPAEEWGTPQMIAAGSNGNVWALGSVGYWGAVLKWDGARWLAYEYQCDSCFDASLTNMAVDADDVVWVGGVETYPYSNGYPAIGRLPDEPGPFMLDRAIDGVLTPIADMAATEEGLWVTGSSWLLRPNGGMRLFTEVPHLENVTRLIVDGHGTTWLHSGWYDGVLQTMDDKGTGTMSDDSGDIVLDNMATAEMAVASNGDLWLAWIEDAVRFQLGHGPRRYIDNEPLDYLPPLQYAIIHDIYVEDARHTWFLFEPTFDADSASPGIWRLDDGGTPADFSDDSWTTFELDKVGADSIVAARDGKLWYGDTTGVYLYGQGGWQQLTAEEAHELIPARDGLLFVNQYNTVLVIEADGNHYWRSVPEIVLNNYALVRSTTRRNTMWRSAADGAIWYWHYDGELGRWDGRSLQTYNNPTRGGFIEVDRYNHVWLVQKYISWEDSTLWRMSPRPDFRLFTGPSTWFITPDERRQFTIGAVSIEGYTNKVTLSIGGLPPGITAELNPSELYPGELAVVTLTTTGAAPAKTTITIGATSGDIKHRQKVTLSVVDQTHNTWLPAMYQQSTIDN